MEAHWFDMITNRYASHVVRAFLRALGGVAEGNEDPAHKFTSKPVKVSILVGGQGVTLQVLSYTPDSWKEELKSIQNGFLGSDLSSLTVDTHASPVLQVWRSLVVLTGAL